MNPVEAVVRGVDRFQQRHAWLGLPVAVMRKFGDDRAGDLAALLAYYAFVAIFPSLLLLVTAFGILLRNNPALQERVLSSALVDFPVIGDQLQQNVKSLNQTGPGLVIGLLGALLGARGIANTAQEALNTVWGVPKAERPGFPWNLLRSLGLLALGVLGAIATGIRIAVLVGTLVVNAALFLAAFRLATAGQVRTRDLAPGAIAAAAVWQVLLAVGGYVVNHYLRHSSQVYGVFGVVLGLVSWLYLQAQITLYLAEADVVRVRRLWPRSLVQPPLTRGDREAYRTYAAAERRRPEQRVEVTYLEPSTNDPQIEPDGHGERPPA